MSKHPNEISPKFTLGIPKTGHTQPKGLLASFSRINRLLITVVLLLWFGNGLSKAWVRIACAQQFYAEWDWGLQSLAFAGATAVLLLLSALCAQKERKLFAQEVNWTKILQENKFLYGFRLSYLTATCTTLTFFSAFLATSIVDNSAKGLACLMSDLGQYELAERIYRLAPDLNHNKASGRFSSMATWHSSSKREEPISLQMKNTAVATVYGSQSLQMANRYFYLGLTCEHAENNSTPEAIYWHNQALGLYRKNNAITKSIDAIAQLAILQDESNKQESQRLLAQAASLVPFKDEAPFVCTPILEHLAARNGDVQKAELFRRTFEKHQTYSENKTFWEALGVVFFAISSSGVGCLLAKQQTLARLIKRKVLDCSMASNPTDMTYSLNQLTTLNLIQKNSRAAERNSLLLLALTEGQKSPTSVQQEIATTDESCISEASKFESIRLALALAIACSFYI